MRIKLKRFLFCCACTLAETRLLPFGFKLIPIQRTNVLWTYSSILNECDQQFEAANGLPSDTMCFYLYVYACVFLSLSLALNVWR